jgi:hypothetical protein
LASYDTLRQALMVGRTATINRLRVVLSEFGLVMGSASRNNQRPPVATR